MYTSINNDRKFSQSGDKFVTFEKNLLKNKIISSARPDQPWGPTSLLYNGYRVFLGGKGGRSMELTPTPTPSRVPRS